MAKSKIKRPVGCERMTRMNPYETYDEKMRRLSDSSGRHVFVVNYVPVDRNGYIPMDKLHLAVPGAGVYRGVQQKIYHFYNDLEGYGIHISREINADSLADAKRKIKKLYPDAKFTTRSKFNNY